MKVKFLGLPGIDTFTERGKKHGIGEVVEVPEKRGKYMLYTYPEGFEEVGAEPASPPPPEADPPETEKSEKPEENKSMQTEEDK